jgi:fructose/tagatose bisphosphate aldolase
MPLITDASQAREIYDETRECGALLLNLNTESRRMTEAIFKAVYDFGGSIGVDDLPVVISVCGVYDERPQIKLMNWLGDPLLGFDMFMADVRLLCSKSTPYRKLRVMTHLDHGQPDGDRALLTERLDDLASVMFDASTRPLEENTRLTAEYVERYGDKVVVEGAVDEITESGSGKARNEPTSVADAVRFIRGTGVDLIVPNVGTEHRSAEQEKRYLAERARELSAAVGKRLVLHGSSSLRPDQYATIAADGIVKMNFFTAVIKRAAAAQMEFELENVNRMLPPEDRRRLVQKGLLPAGLIDERIGAKLDVFGDATTRRVWIEAASKVMSDAMAAVGYARFAK